MGTLNIQRIFFLESEVWEGDFPRDDYREEVWENISASEAAKVLMREGLSFKASGAEWAADPDGSYIIDYGLGKRVEKSGHLTGFHDRVLNAIIEKVG